MRGKSNQKITPKKKQTPKKTPKKTTKRVQTKVSKGSEINNKRIPVKVWINDYKSQFEKYNAYCNQNNWIFSEDIETEYDAQKTISKIVLDRLKYFVNKFEPYLKYKYAQEFLSLMRTPVTLFTERCNTYINTHDWLSISDKERQIAEMEFQSNLISDSNKLKDVLRSLNLDDEVLSLDLPIHADKPIPMLMERVVESRFPQIVDFKETLKSEEIIDTSNSPTSTYFDVKDSTELFINMKNPPIYDINKHYFEQPDYVIDFYKEELNKIKKGINIAGVHISGWLYWHINYFKTDIPMVMFKGTPLYNPNEERLITNPMLRDNELFLAECYEKADEQNKGLFIFGTRRFGKALKDDEYLYYTDGSRRKIGNSRVGDEIFGADGKPTKIVGVYPQGKISLFRVRFSDGRSVVCCNNHLWKVFDYTVDKWRILSLKEISKNYKKIIKDKNDNIEIFNYHIPITKPLQYKDGVDSFISPYLLGLWVGGLNMNEDSLLKKYSDIIDLKVLKDKNLIKNKNIPEECFKWSYEDRLDLLRGLQDSDGIFIDGDIISFHKEKGYLRSYLYRLLNELGIYCEIDIKIDTLIKKDKEYKTFITDIEYVGEDYATCIEVNNRDKLFLTTDCIVTHNTVIESSMLTWRTTVVENSESIVIGGDEGDLQKLSKTLEIGFSNVNPAFRLTRNNNDWSTQIQFGLKDKSGIRIPYSDIFIRNVNSGKKQGSLKTAGATPTAWIVDEAGKFNCKKMYKQAIPSFQNPMGWGVVPLLVGCLTAGNKVWTKKGKLVNIEDLKKEDGILGMSSDGVQSEDINWFKPPSYKECVEIVTEFETIRCSKDHPLLVTKVSNNPKAQLFKAEELKEGDFLISTFVKVFGSKDDNKSFKRGKNKSLIDLSELTENSLRRYFKGLFLNFNTSYEDNFRLELDWDLDKLATIKYYLLKLGIYSFIDNDKLFIDRLRDLWEVYTNLLEDNDLKLELISYLSNKEDRVVSGYWLDFKKREDFDKGDYFVGKRFRNINFFKVLSVKDIGMQKVYNLNTSISHSYITGTFISGNTGGESELSRDAQDMLTNPVANEIIPMDWQEFENKYVRNKNHVTWQRKDFGVFVPAQMSFKTGIKKKDTNLSDFLEVKNSKLKKINIKVTDWEQSLKVIQDSRDKLKKKQSDLNDEKMGYPLDPMECFLNRIENPFPAVESQQHKDDIISQGNTGKLVDIYKKEGTTRLGYVFSDKELASFPFEGGNIDAPVLMFEDPPVDNEIDSTYVAGLDHYKHDKSNTDSVGALYIFKRMVNLGEWSNRIVCSYCSRPDSMDKFNEMVEKLLEGYGAVCLMENADISFQQYLMRKHKDNILLARGEDFSKRFVNPNSIQNNKYGLNPNQKNQQYLLNLVISYCNEDIVVGKDENNMDITVKGVTQINDIVLLDEIINFSYGGNFDRIIAFGHALAWAKYLDSMHIMPKEKINREDNYYRSKLKKEKLRGKSPYSLRSYNPYRK